jgi:hypothetical protein
VAEPRYTDRDMALILKRAATLQAQNEEPKHSLGDIESIAGEVGIPRELIARAAAELGSGSSRSSLLGQPTSYYVTTTVPGSLPRAAHADLVALVRRTVGDPGRVSPLGEGFEWQRSTGYSTLTVAISERGTGTTVRVEGEHEGNRTMTYIVPTVASGVVALFVGGVVSLPLGVAVGLGGIGAGWIGARLLWTRIARRAEERVRRLHDALVNEVRAAGSEGKDRPSNP